MVVAADLESQREKYNIQKNISFVKVGSKVSKGETVCLIEVMKLFTAVESEFNGIIEKVFVVDGDLVEFDQPLFLISELQEK